MFRVDQEEHHDLHNLSSVNSNNAAAANGKDLSSHANGEGLPGVTLLDVEQGSSDTDCKTFVLSLEEFFIQTLKERYRYGPNFIELLKHKILLNQIRLPPRLYSIVMLSKQHKNTSHKQCIWYDIFASSMCKISKLFFLAY